MIYKPALVVMAAGMGSRYGGLKQIDPITDRGEIILDFSLYDAMLAGFEEVVFVIKKENEADFHALIDERAGTRLNVHYAFQALDDIPSGYEIPEGREKPWGTGHAVRAARDIVKGPFAVINADDYYGSSAFHHMYDFLERSCPVYVNYASAEAADAAKSDAQDEPALYSMVAFQLSNTLSESGHVARGVCKVSEDGKLVDIHERTMIRRVAAGEKILEEGGAIASGAAEATGAAEDASPIGYSEDGGDTWALLPEDTPVSMNFWGFTNDFMDELDARFQNFLDSVPSSPDPLKAEYFLPGVVDQLLNEGKAEVQVLRSSDKWYGVTYKEDKPDVVDALRSMKDKGIYPEVLWG